MTINENPTVVLFVTGNNIGSCIFDKPGKLYFSKLLVCAYVILIIIHIDGYNRRILFKFLNEKHN